MFTLRFSSTRRGARLARLLAVRQLTEWDAPSDKAEAIVAELAAFADRWGVEEGPAPRKTVWAEVVCGA